MTKQLEHTPASGAVLGVIMAFADYERQIAELTTRLAALEKAAEPKPLEPPNGAAILTEPSGDVCPWCNHTPEEHRAYRVGYAAGRIGQEPDTCPYLDHAPFADSWTEGHRVGYAVWEQLNPEPDETDGE